jgi:uncharacterized protein
MPASTANVATEKPAPYMKQLCRHFGHKVDVTFDDERGSIALAMGRCRLDASRPGILQLHVEAEDAAGLERTQQVIGSHLERFGRRDALSVSWG